MYCSGAFHRQINTTVRRQCTQTSHTTIITGIINTMYMQSIYIVICSVISPPLQLPIPLSPPQTLNGTGLCSEFILSFFLLCSSCSNSFLFGGWKSLWSCYNLTVAPGMTERGTFWYTFDLVTYLSLFFLHFFLPFRVRLFQVTVFITLCLLFYHFSIILWQIFLKQMRSHKKMLQYIVFNLFYMFQHIYCQFNVAQADITDKKYYLQYSACALVDCFPLNY